MLKHRLAISDSSIKGHRLKEIKKTILEYVHYNGDDGSFVLVNDALGATRKLHLLELYKGIMRKKGMYLNRSDFNDEQGHRYTIEFLIAKDGEKMYIIKTSIFPYNRFVEPQFSRGVTLIKAV